MSGVVESRGLTASVPLQATAMSRLRHPGILEMVEPMEETRSEITFATEPILSSLAGSLSSARAGGVLEGVDLDEIEVEEPDYYERFRGGTNHKPSLSPDPEGHPADRVRPVVLTLVGQAHPQQYLARVNSHKRQGRLEARRTQLDDQHNRRGWRSLVVPGARQPAAGECSGECGQTPSHGFMNAHC